MKPINRVVYALWLGDEEICPERQKAIDNLPKNSVLITKANLNDFVLKRHPLHPAYEYLSTIHKSDYLRCYLMHHYGGGYTDIKYSNIDWDLGFDTMNYNKDIMMLGVKTTYGHTYSGIEEWSEDLKTNIISNIDKLACVSFLICRKSKLTTEWYDEVNRRLDAFLPGLKNSPAKYTSECFHPHLGYALECPDWEGGSKHKTNYPVSWNILLSQILYPLQIKYLKHINNKVMIHDL